LFGGFGVDQFTDPDGIQAIQSRGIQPQPFSVFAFFRPLSRDLTQRDLHHEHLHTYKPVNSQIFF